MTTLTADLVLVGAGKERLAHTWERTGDSNTLRMPLDEYKKLMRCGYLGTIDFLISAINEKGELELEEAKKVRSKDIMYREDVYERAEQALIDSWPDFVGLLDQIG